MRRRARTRVNPTLRPAATYRPRVRAPAGRLLRVLDVRDGGNVDVDQLAADLFDPADIDVLYHVAGFGIDRHRAARAFPLQALGRGDQGIAVGLTFGLFQRRVDDVHAVIAADREEVGVTLELGVVGLHEGFVHL